MSGWYGSMDMGGVGHPHLTDGDFFRSHNMAQEEAAAAGMTEAKFHPQSGSSMRVLAKKAGVGLVAGAVVGMVLLKVPMYNSMMSKDKSWQAAALGAAVAVPLAAMYA